MQKQWKHHVVALNLLLWLQFVRWLSATALHKIKRERNGEHKEAADEKKHREREERKRVQQQLKIEKQMNSRNCHIAY